MNNWLKQGTKPESKLKNAMAMDNGIAMEDMFEL